MYEGNSSHVGESQRRAVSVQYSNVELEPLWQHARWIPLVSEHAQSVLFSVVGLTRNSAPIHSILWLPQLTLIGIYDKEIQAPEMGMFYALLCSIHVA